MNELLKILLPIIVPRPISSCPCSFDMIVVASSGTDVPTATIVAPIMNELIPKVAAIGTNESDVLFSGEETVGPIEATSEVIFDKEPILHEPEELTVVEGEDVEEAVEMHEDMEEKVAKKDVNLMPKFPWKWVALIGTVVIGGLLIAGYVYLPRAKANIYVSAEKKPLSLNFSGEKDAKLDTEKVIIPTQVIEATKEESKKYPATGKKDAGTKATGVVRVSNLSGSTITIATFVPKGRTDLVYTANNSATVDDGEIVDVNVTAKNPGEAYNGFSSADFAPASGDIGGLQLRSNATGMTGGTTKEISVVSQGDVNTAKDALAKEANDAATAEFTTKSSEIKIIEETKKSEIVSATASPDVNGEATEFTMTVKVTIKALGFNLNDVSKLISSEVERQLGFAKSIIDDGSKTAEIALDASDLTTGKISGTIKTTAYVSTKLDEKAIKIELSGLNNAKATNYLTGIDGVESITVEYWPTFIKSFPRIQSHIFLTIQVSDSSRK